MLCCPVGRHIGADYTHFSRGDDETAQKRPEMRSLVDDFKPIAGPVRLTAKAACDYTERPEVTAIPPVASESEQMLRREELAAVERAEARLAAGTFGLSIESGRPIPDDRLEAVPTAERTAEEEARKRAGTTRLAWNIRPPEPIPGGGVSKPSIATARIDRRLTDSCLSGRRELHEVMRR